MSRPAPDQPAPERSIDVVLVDDHTLVRQGLRSLLEREPDVRVVGEAGTPAAAMEVVASNRSALVLLDLKPSGVPGPVGLDLCEQLVAAFPDLAVLVLTTSLDDGAVVGALRRGARGYVVKEGDVSELLRAVRTVASGKNAFDPKGAAARALRPSAPSTIVGRALTTRELEVLRLLARGKSNGEIGRTLFISQTTAKFHVANIMRKLEVGQRAAAVYVASKMGAL